MNTENGKIYKLTLSGPAPENNEINVEKNISEDLAHKILVLLVPTGSASTKLVDAAGDFSKTEAIGDLSPKLFMVQKRPVTDIEKIACLAYYLSYYRNTPAFKTEDLSELNREAQQVRLSNPSASARNAVQFGYLSPAGGGRKQITTTGEAAVEALPDREALRGTLKNVREPRTHQSNKNRT